MRNSIAELEEEKGNLQLQLLDFEEVAHKTGELMQVIFYWRVIIHNLVQVSLGRLSDIIMFCKIALSTVESASC